MAPELQLALAVNLRIIGSPVIDQLPAQAIGLLELQLLCQPLIRHTDPQIQIGVAALGARGLVGNQIVGGIDRVWCH